MAYLSFNERQQLEKCFGMGSGCVLDFTNKTFEWFIEDAVNRRIYDETYSQSGTSKANRLREFFKVEPACVVGSLIEKLISYARIKSEPPPEDLLDSCQKIADRLKKSTPALENITIDTSDAAFEALTNAVRQSIESNRPDIELDRLHTFFTMYLRHLCERHGIQVTRDDPVHNLLGKYLKYLTTKGCIQSEMT